MASWQFEPKLRELAGDGEDGFVVLDMSTGEQAGDLPVLARHVDIVAVVVEYNTATRDELRRVLDDLSRSGAKQVVVIAVASPSARRRAHAQMVDQSRPPPSRGKGHDRPIAALEPYGSQDDDQDDQDVRTRDSHPAKARWGDPSEHVTEDHPGGIGSRRPR
jgi:Mrp family chromosome partitioning ATPase